MGEQETKLEPMNARFAKTMEILTLACLILVVVPGLAYIILTSGFVGVNSAYHHWGQPAYQFWEATKGIKISGYAWFLEDLADMDCLTLVGVLVLALIPVLSIVSAMFKMDRKYKIICVIIIIELVIAIIRPILIGGIGH